jgi:uncharacterized damage-inducible protein DinB
MKTALAVAVLAASWSLAAFAQTAPPTPAAWLRSAYTNLSAFLPRAAEMMPEEHYGLRPGTQPEVRTFGQLIGHLANYNYLWCSQAKGEKNPAASQDFEKLTSKAALVKAVTEAVAYCGTAYSALTDTSGQEVLAFTQENGRQNQSRRMNLLMLNFGHTFEHYGNVVTYMRTKNIVPPSSEPR